MITKKNSITKDHIGKYLEEIEASLKNDIGLILPTYQQHFLQTNIGAGYFAIPRLIFPEIDNLGALYQGNIRETQRAAINFMKDYFGLVNTEYKTKSAFIYLIYRHGLMHQHVPKNMSYKKQSVGWIISMNSTAGHLSTYGKTIQLDATQLYLDLLTALNFYKNDILSDKENLIERFISAHSKMIEPISKTNLIAKKGYVDQTDFDFLK
jgi:hypothetical protein